MNSIDFSILKDKTILFVDNTAINRVILIVEDKDKNKEYYWIDSEKNFYGISLPVIYKISEEDFNRYTTKDVIYD